MSFKITDSVTYVGKRDWELRTFHGEEYSTHRGSTYNSYLIRDEKVALIDTIWNPYSEEFVENLKKEIDLKEIDYVIVNHGEIDHSGSLSRLMEEIPDTPIYCTKNAVSSLKGQYHKDWNFNTVKTGDKLSLGSKELIFIEARMLHWPDSMFCYLTEENILFSNDAFGQHLATEQVYNDLVDQCELYQEAIKYYANILTPFSSLVIDKIKEVLSFNLPLNMICTSHGVIWRDNPVQIVEQYLKWADNYQENQITILYDSMWDNTKKMAEAIKKGIQQEDKEVIIKLYNIARTDKNDVITEVFKSKGILVGSSTINNGILSSTAAILEEMRGLGFKNKKAAAFGSYGWGGQSTKMISDRLKEGGFELINDGIRVLWTPDEEATKRCEEFGKSFIKSFV
ncbi:MAG: anaerobic nitric oxide reductase flavorubredoxin [Epulopiscium sp.]|nr:anaerobic nitric oxide reductase flavorubredoxin [Candidatus Epulonipiscium sp.]